MKEGAELILATKRFAKDDPAKSWWYILSTSFLLALCLSVTLLPVSWFAKGISSIFTGLLTLRLFVIYHDQQHHAILPNSKVAEYYMRLFGLYALSASSIWRSSHNHHHNHNSKLRGSHIGSFPIMTKTQFLRSPKGRRFKYLFVRHPATIALGYLFMFVYGMCINPFLNNPKKHTDCLVALILHIGIAIGLLTVFGWRELLFFQTIPSLIAFAMGTYLFYAQHNFPGVAFRDNAGWTYDKAALESSSFMKTGPIMQWFTGNIGYHHVHHLNAKIPFYRLPEAVQALPELQNPKVTTLKPTDIVKCLRLKVWDVDTQRMVGFRELKSS